MQRSRRDLPPTAIPPPLSPKPRNSPTSENRGLSCGLSTIPKLLENPDMRRGTNLKYLFAPLPLRLHKLINAETDNIHLQADSPVVCNLRILHDLQTNRTRRIKPLSHG